MFTSSFAFANSEEDNFAEILANGTLSEEKATLTSSDGTTYLVNMYKSDEKIINAGTKNVEDIVYSKTYVSKLSPENMERVSPRSNGSLEEWDETGDVLATMTIYYQKMVRNI